MGTTDQFVATKDAPAPFDPAHAYETGIWNVMRQTTQSLVHVPRGGGQPVPDAASSCGFTDKENESYRCTLRSGLEFSDGTKVTADDVKYSIQRVIDIKDDNGPAGLLDNIDTMETKGDAEIVFHLKTPDATFPYKLATPAAGIVPQDKYEPKKLRNGFEIDGSGPYKLKAEVKDDQAVKVTFTKNPNYKGDLKLANDKVELRSFPTAEAMGTALDKGDIDMMTRAMTPAQIQQMQVSPSKDINLVEMPGLEIRYLGFNTDDPSVKNKAVRQALAQAIDRSALASKVYGTTAEPLYSLIPTSIAGHTNSFFNKYGEASKAKAAGILKAANIYDPGQAHPQLHQGPLRFEHRGRVQDPLAAAERDRPVQHHGPGHRVDEVPPGAEEGRLRGLRPRLVPRLPGPGQLHRAVLRQGQLPQHPVRQRRDPQHADPGVPGGRRPQPGGQVLRADPGHRRQRRPGHPAVAGQAVRRGPHRHHRHRMGHQLLVQPPALGAGAGQELKHDPAAVLPCRPAISVGRTVRHVYVKNRNRWLTMPLAAGVAAGLLSGCGSQQGSGAASGGGSVVMGMSDDILATDPASGYDPGSWLLFNNVFQSLLSFPKGSSTPEPEAAQACSFDRGGSTVYRCTLRPGLTFSNGDALTSEDVKYSFERVLKINDPSGPASMLTSLGKIDTPDAKSVVFHLKVPDATFPSKIASGAGSIVDHKEYPADKLRTDGEAIGSGVYKLDSFSDKQAVFSVNSSYKGTVKAKNSGLTLKLFHGDQQGPGPGAGQGPDRPRLPRPQRQGHRGAAELRPTPTNRASTSSRAPAPRSRTWSST